MKRMTLNTQTILRYLKAFRTYGVGGVYYWGIYSRTILRTAPILCGQDDDFELHTLVCKKDLVSSIWTLKTFYHFSETRPRLLIYSDGSLNQADINQLTHHFINAKIVSRDQFNVDMERFLKDFKHSLRYSKIESFYCALKLFGPMFYPQKNGVLYLDSDVLFFQKPVDMLDYIKTGKPFHMSDYQNFYAYPAEILRMEFGVNMISNLNAGLFYISKNDYSDHIELVEEYFEKTAIFKSKVFDVNKHEQTLASILLSKANAARLNGNYQISTDPITAKTVSHHFVRDGSRGAFYTRGLRRLKSIEFIKEIGQ